MQLRPQKHGTAVIRTRYDPTIKRCRTRVIGLLAHDATDVPDELDEQLTFAERIEVQGHIARQTAMRLRLKQAQAAAELAQTIRHATAWYRRQIASPELTQLAASARTEWTELLAAMSTAGVGRTRKRKPAK